MIKDLYNKVLPLTASYSKFFQVFSCTDDNIVKMIPIHKDAQKQIKMMYYARQSSSRLAAIVGVYGDTGVKP